MERRAFLKSLIAVGVGAILPITSAIPVTFYDVMVRTNDKKVQGCVAALLEPNLILSDLPRKLLDGPE